MPERRLQRTRAQYQECPTAPNGLHVWARRRDGRICAYCDKREYSNFNAGLTIPVGPMNSVSLPLPPQSFIDKILRDNDEPR